MGEDSGSSRFILMGESFPWGNRFHGGILVAVKDSFGWGICVTSVSWHSFSCSLFRGRTFLTLWDLLILILNALYQYLTGGLRHGLTGHDDDDKRVFHFFFAP